MPEFLFILTTLLQELKNFQIPNCLDLSPEYYFLVPVKLLYHFLEVMELQNPLGWKKISKIMESKTTTESYP